MKMFLNALQLPERRQMPALNLNNTIVTYGQLATAVQQRAQQLKTLAGSRVMVVHEDLTERVVDALALLHAGCWCGMPHPLYDAALVRDLRQNSTCLFITTAASAGSFPAERTIIHGAENMPQLPGAVNMGSRGDGGVLLLASKKRNSDQAWMVDTDTILEHSKLLAQTWQLKEGMLHAAGGRTRYCGLADWVLPVLHSGGTLMLNNPAGLPTGSEAAETLLCIDGYELAGLLQQPASLLQQRTKTVVLLNSDTAIPTGHIEQWKKQYPHLPVAHYVCRPYGIPAVVAVGNTGEDTATESETLTLRHPLGNTAIGIKDDAGHQTPVNVKGRLLVRSALLACPVNLLTGERALQEAGITDTGYSARFLASGSIQLLHHQYRPLHLPDGSEVQAEQLELLLLSMPGILQAAVFESIQPDMTVPAAALAAEAGITAVQVRKWLARRLPAAQVPAGFVFLKTVPFNEDGSADTEKFSHIALESGVEEIAEGAGAQLLHICRELLNANDLGPDDNFFEWGLHSLLATRLISAIRRHMQAELAIKDIFVHSTVNGLLLCIESRQNGEALPPVTPQPRQNRLPLSWAQERLWFIHRMQGSRAYHVPVLLRLQGRVNEAALGKAMQQLAERHEAIRTVIKDDEDGQWQEIIPAQNLPVLLQPLRQFDTADALEQFVKQVTDEPFDLAHGPLLRTHLLQQQPGEYLLLVVMHHIAADGWSAAVMLHELKELYEAALHNRPHTLPQLEVQYADYAIWQRRHLAPKVFDVQAAYWKQQLEDLSLLQLPADYPRPAVQSTRGGVYRTRIDRQQHQQLEQLSRTHGATLFMTLLAAFKTLLYRYTGQQDICIGTAIANRNRSETEGLIGFFVNALALRSRLSGTQSFVQLLEQVKQTTLQAYAHQDLPFEKLVEIAETRRDISRSPVFQVMFALQNTPDAAIGTLGQATLSIEPLNQAHSKFDLEVQLEETPAGLQVQVEYCADLFAPGSIARMMEQYTVLLRAISECPVQQLCMLPVQTAGELEQLQLFNHTAFNYNREATVVQLFEAQAEARPDHTALVMGTGTVSYAQLNRQANQMAHWLRQQGVQKGQAIGLLAKRSPDMIAAMLGILKCGAVYVPLHHSYPAGRIQHMVQTAAVSMVIYTDNEPADRPVIEGCLMAGMSEAANAPCENPGIHIHSSDGAYIMFTSGTTGRPKGILVSHRNIVKLAADPGDVAILSTDRVLQWSNFAFDGSTWEIYNTLLAGATLCLLTEEAVSDTQQLAALVQEQQLTVLFVTTALFNALTDTVAERLTGLRRLLFGGEKVSVPHVQRALQVLGTDKLVHVYGPTETTTYATSYVVQHIHSCGTIPIGRPLANTQLYVLDAAGQTVPLGGTGELYIGGDGVATGYVNNADLTAEKFIELPGRGRCYKTGDLVRWLPEGVIEFTGRADNQVKIRGYRIEPAEVESCINALDLVETSCVLVQGETDVTRHLAAYYVPAPSSAHHEVTTGLLQEALQQVLPEYMIPAVWVPLKQMPLTPNGKIDRKQLALMGAAHHTTGVVYQAPETTLEMQLAAIWRQLLTVEQPGVHDNFFQLGGHSLLATRLTSAVRRQLQVELAVRDIFRYPTIAGQARLLENLTGSAAQPAITPRTGGGPVPLSFTQERLWFIHQLQGTEAYHMPGLFRLEGPLDINVLEQAFRGLLERHEVLRTVYQQGENDLPGQHLLNAAAWQAEFVKDTYFADEESLNGYLLDAIQQPFDLGKDFMLRVTVIRLSPSLHLLLLVVHHIACDGWSLAILLNELTVLYRAALHQQLQALPPLPVQYADVAVWQRSAADSDTSAALLQWWTERLQNITRLDLPLDFQRPAVQSTQGALLHFQLTPELRQALEKLSHEQGVTLFMTLLAAFKVMLYHYTSQHDICVGVPIANRTRQEMEPLIGFFVNTLALRSQLDPSISFTAFLNEVKNSTLEAYARQEVPFEKIVEAADAGRDLSRNPVFDVMFALRNNPELPALELEGLHIISRALPHTTSQFDLSVELESSGEGLLMEIEYCTDLFKKETIERMAGHYRQLLLSILEEPQAPSGSYSLLTAEEKVRLDSFNNTKVPVNYSHTTDRRIDETAFRHPLRIAVAHNGRFVTYRQLKEGAEAIAAFLMHHISFEPENITGLLMDRSELMIRSVYGIWKAGGAYVPLHPELPHDRLAVIVNDSAMPVLFYEARYHDRALQLLHECEPLQAIVCLDEAGEPGVLPAGKHSWYSQHVQQAARKQPLLLQSRAEGLAYVIYTSGSTGRPKGAMVEHKGMLNHLLAMVSGLQLDEHSRIAQNASQSFDISVWQMFNALITGGTTYIYGQDIVMRPLDFMQQVHNDRISILQIVPSYLLVMLDELEERPQPGLFARMKYCLVTGETVKRSLLVRWFRLLPGIKVVNAYGPAEAADDITHYIMDSPPHNPAVPVGTVLQNLHIYIVNSFGRRCPVGVKGEIWVSGDGVGRGYLNNPGRTRAAFITDPFIEGSEVPLYKTGDMGRYLPNGVIEFFGRMDYQVKIRGHRIELGEIEQHLNELPAVKESVVTDWEDNSGQPYLCAYVILAYETTADKLKQELEQKLPGYMVPQFLLPMDEFPLTPNGKINRSALPRPGLPGAGDTAAMPPRNKTEKTIHAVWEQLLGVKVPGVNNNFFTMGGQSLKATQLVSRIHRQLGVRLTVKDIFTHPDIAGQARLVQEATAAACTPIMPVARQPWYPASSAQQRLWIIDRFEKELTAYNASAAFWLRGAVNVEAFSQAVNFVTGRHESLRTTFGDVNGQPVQFIHEPGQMNLELQTEDLRSTSATLETVQNEVRRRAGYPMNLETGPLFQAGLYLLPGNIACFWCTMHHIICDGWSNNLLVQEILTCYHELTQGRMPQLQPLTVQYKDYAAWQQQQMQEPAFAVHRSYWLQKLGGQLPVLELPAFRSRPAVQTFNGSTLRYVFAPAVLHSLEQLTARSNGSLFITITAFINVLLYRYTGQTDIITGTITAGRNHPDLEDQVGYYLNTLALRTLVQPDLPFETFLHQVKENVLEAFQHQDYPFDRLLNELDFERDMSRNPVFDVLVALQNFDADEDELMRSRLEGMEVEPLELHTDTAMFDLDFDFTPRAGGLHLALAYNTDIYDESQIKALVRHFEMLVLSAANAVHTPVSRLEMLHPDDIAQLHGFNQTEKELPLHLTFHHYLERYALEKPAHPAVICNNTVWSYEQLNTAVNGLAHFLLEKAPLKANDMVAVFLERSEKMMASILAVWKCGGAYIPIERKYPDNRILSLLEDGGVKYMIAARSLVTPVLEARLAEKCPVFFIEDMLAEAPMLPAGNPGIDVQPEQLAFTIFTSGSTGKPKGAMNQHIGMMNHALATVDYLEMKDNAVLVQNASHGFDISVWQFFTALITGGTTLVFDDGMVAQPEMLLRQLIQHKATVFQVVPSYLTMLLDIIEKNRAAYPLPLESLVCCGEAVKPALIRRWLGQYQGVRLVNDYGPAEASDGTSWYVFYDVPGHMTSLPIGKSIYNMSTYIVDAHMNLCPEGVTGEICVAGVGVGLGYLNDPEKTALVFMDDVFAPWKKQRLYKTGDLGRYLPGGLLEFHGRKDYQVKINGQRIELGEIETNMAMLPGVKAAAVVDAPDADGRKYLCGYAVLFDNTPATAATLKEMLGRELPPYMIPRTIQLLPELPVTPNGKVDRKLLTRMASENNPAGMTVHVAPGTEMEKLLAEAWAFVLKKDRPGIADNFYDCGGDSISAIQVSAYLFRHGYRAEIKDIMRYATIRELAPLLQPVQRMASQEAVTGLVPLTPIQAGFFASGRQQPNHYHQSMLLLATGGFNTGYVKEALQYLLEIHDGLRMRYTWHDGAPVQENLPPGQPVWLEVYNGMEVEDELAWMHATALKVQEGFTLQGGQLLRAALMHTPAGHFLLLVAHHLVIDAMSWRILLDDFGTLYQQLTQGKPLQLPPKTNSFKEWAEHLQQYATTKTLLAEKPWWQHIARYATHQLPLLQPAETATGASLRHHHFELDIDTTLQLTVRAHQAFGTTTEDLLLAALGIATQKVFGLPHLVIMLESHGRAPLFEHLNTTRTVGWFTSEYPVLLDMENSADRARLIKTIKDNLRKTPHLGLGFGLLQHLAPDEERISMQRPQIIFNYLGQFDDEPGNGPFRILPEAPGCDEAPADTCDYPLEFTAMLQNGRMIIGLACPEALLPDGTIEQWLTAFRHSLAELTGFCAGRSHTEVTASDFDYKDLSLDDLEDLQMVLEN